MIPVLLVLVAFPAGWLTGAAWQARRTRRVLAARPALVAHLAQLRGGAQR